MNKVGYFRWNGEHEEWLRENYAQLGKKGCARALGCSESSVRNKAKRMHLCLVPEVRVMLRREGLRAYYRRMRVRMAIGLPVAFYLESPYKDEEIQLRNRMHRRDYVLGSPKVREQRYTIYYDEETERSEKMEETAKEKGFKVIELEKNK